MAKTKKEKNKPEDKKKHFFKKGSGGPRAQWSGSISFGLVNIPVTLQTAVREKALHFHLFRSKDHCKIRRKYVCENDHKEVPSEQIVKAYEIEKGKHVTLEEGEMSKLMPKASREISLLQFVDLKEIDPVYFTRPYYLLPQKDAKKAYFLLVESLRRTGKAGIAKIIMRNHQYLALIRLYKNVLCLETLHYHDEVLEPAKVEKPADLPGPREISAAEKLIESLSEKFEPEKLFDDYRESILKALRQKKQFKLKDTEAKEEKGAEVVDLMAALEASLKKSKKAA